jgi:hypothetical protein
MSHPRTRLSLEHLEVRENPATLFSETFDSLAPPALPAGWTAWSSDGTAAFASAAQGANGTNGLVTAGGSRTAALAWHPQTVPADTGAAVSVRADSLVPALVFTRGTNLDTADRSYLAAVVTRGVNVQLLEVTGATVKTLGSVSSPSSAYLSGKWVRVSLVPDGTSAKVSVTRSDTGAYLNASGTWQAAQAFAISGTTALTPAEGKVGVGRNLAYSGTVALDDFAALSKPTPPPPPAPPPVAVAQSFDSTAVGSAPAGWATWSSGPSGAFAVSTARALSPANGFTSGGQSTSAARAWDGTELPADSDVSAAIYLDSLIQAQVFTRGSNLNTATPSYYAVNVVRGMQANLVKVVNGVETVIGSVRSADYYSGQWTRVRLIAEGDRLRVQIYRTDTRQWMSPDGRWSDSPDFALELRDTSITGGGKAGVARKSGAAGALTIDDFEAKSAGVASGPQVTVTRVTGTGNVTGEVTFRAAVTGGFNRVEFRLNNIVRAVSATAPAEWTFDSTTVDNGNYTLVVRAFDAAGNVTSKEFAFAVSNPNAAPLPVPTVPRHYTHIRVAQLAYSGTPIGNAFEQNLLKNSVDLVIPNTQYLGPIDSTSPNTPQLIYSNVSNLYQGLLSDWLEYADRHGVSREQAFYHVTRATAWQGASPSAQPVTWFWGVYQSANGGPATDVTSAARNGRNFSVQFGGAGTSTSIAYVERFREMNVVLSRAAAAGASGVWEYVSAVDAAGNPTAWKTLSLVSDGTTRLTTSGRITFDPPKDWVASAGQPGAARLFAVRYRVTAGTAEQNAVLFTVFGRDYAAANGKNFGTIPAFDYAADKDGDGYLNDAEYAGRTAGMDARFVYESRLFYPYYGQMRYVTNPSSSAVRHWAAEYHERLLNATPQADGVFMDNATGNLPFPGIGVLEPTATYSLDSGALMTTLSREIAPRWVLANTAGGANTADAITAASGGVFEEFLIRAMQANWSEVGDAVNLAARRLNTPGDAYLVIDSSAAGGSRLDPRTQLATLSYYYLMGDPDRTFLMFFGGDAPSTSWTEHWSAAAAVDVGKPAGAMRVFATGADPANTQLTYQVLARDYDKALVLYKPLSYAQGKGEGTTGNNTATTHQLGGVYRVVNANGTLGGFVTSITLRNGEGAVLVKA